MQQYVINHIHCCIQEYNLMNYCKLICEFTNLHVLLYIIQARNKEALLSKFNLAIPVFHSYGHKLKCQVWYYIIYMYVLCVCVRACVHMRACVCACVCTYHETRSKSIRNSEPYMHTWLHFYVCLYNSVFPMN